MTKRTRFEFLQAFIILLFIAPFAWSQADRATITGTVTDPSGAVIPGVHVVVTNADTLTRYPAATNQTGIYQVPNLPVGPYSVEINQSGFRNYKQSGIILVAAQVLKLDITLAIGSTAETVNVVATAPLEAATSSVAMTMEQSVIRDLPLNANNGRDALNLMLSTVPAMEGSVATSGTQTWLRIAGGEEMTNSIYIDGIEGTAGNQGSMPTPGLDALQEMQVASLSSDAEMGGSSGTSILYELKSGTNKFHGSVFEYLQNNALDANTWANNFWAGTCAPGNTACKKQYQIAPYRFNDYGGSAGGPIWKNHTFVFGDYEYYSQTNMALNPGSTTVPTAKMLNGDFSELLTQGTKSGTIMTSGATPAPWINPCTGSAYQYGQIFDPNTQQIVNGQTCATPFSGNVIPSGRISSQAKQVAGIYSKYYAPTVSTRIFNNFPTNASGSPEFTKRTFDIKVDHNFSERNHLSGSFDYVNWYSLGLNGGFGYANAGPFSSYFKSTGPKEMYRLVDNYNFSSNVVNTFGIGFSRDPTVQQPQMSVKDSSYGFNSDSTVFPLISYGAASNGVGEAGISSAVFAYYNYNAYHLQDALAWQKGKHSFKFGGSLIAQQMNSSFGGDIPEYNFVPDTGGPIDPGLTPYVGSGFASMMLGNVQSAAIQTSNSSYPRQKTFALFAVDDWKVTPKLTLNLGLRWDVTLPGHDATGRWENFDLTATNPNWAPYTGAWVFSQNSGTTFETDNDWHQLGPHIGAAYQLKPKWVLRGAYGRSYIPLGAFSSGYGPAFPANQTTEAFGTSQVLSPGEGMTAFNWDKGYPGQYILPPQNSTASTFGIWDYPMYIDPHFLHLGVMQDVNIGAQYELSRNMVLDMRYMRNTGSNLMDPGRSLYKEYAPFSAYQALLEQPSNGPCPGGIWATINSAASAAACGVPYPYAGFNGAAEAAIAPYPQVFSSWANIETFGDPKARGISAFNALVVEMKARNTHGLYIDYSYTLSKQTSTQNGMSNFSNNWGYYAQSPQDWQNANWIDYWDQTHVAKGYITYDLPFGRSKHWLAGGSRALDYAVGGWTIGYYGMYASGQPVEYIPSNYQLPWYYTTQRANFASGFNANNMKNLFHGNNVDLRNLNNSVNTDFSPSSFDANLTAAAPFGNTPWGFDHWRWDSDPADESMSLMKHFGFGPDGRIKASLRADFFNVFNRHAFAGLDTWPSTSDFGQITGLSGSVTPRVIQLGARVEW